MPKSRLIGSAKRQKEDTERDERAWIARFGLVIATVVVLLGAVYWFGRLFPAAYTPEPPGTPSNRKETSIYTGMNEKAVALKIDRATRKMVEETKAKRLAQMEQSRRRTELMRELNATKLRYIKACEYAQKNKDNERARESLEVRVESARKEAIEAAFEYRRFLRNEGIWAKWPESRKKSLESYVAELQQTRDLFPETESSGMKQGTGGGI